MNQKSNDNFTIRFASPGDTPLILYFIKALAEYEKMADQVIATESILREWLFEKKAAEVLIGELDGNPIGFALFFHNFSTFLGRAGIYLEDLFVLPEYRNKKFGSRFLQRLAKIALERECGRLEWWCLDWNETSIAFYRSLGAEPMDAWTVYRISGDALTRLAGKSAQPI